MVLLEKLRVISIYPNDPYDYDGVNENILVDLGGKKMWLVGDRNGHIYGIDELIL